MKSPVNLKIVAGSSLDGHPNNTNSNLPKKEHEVAGDLGYPEKSEKWFILACMYISMFMYYYIYMYILYSIYEI